MYNNPNLKIAIGILLFLSLATCQNEEQVQSPTPAQILFEQFQLLPTADTLRMGLAPPTSPIPRPIPTKEFVAGVDSTLRATMIYPDTTDLRVTASWKISLDNDHFACLADLEQYWYRFKYLLVYSIPQEEFVQLKPVAFFYGGEGGQIARESWLFDFKAIPTMVIKNAERSNRPSPTNPEEWEETERNLIARSQWSSGQFRTVPTKDSLYWLERIPVSQE